MDNAQLNAQLKNLTSKCEDVKHEKKLLTNDFDSLKDIVKKSGIASLILLVFRIIVLEIFLDSKSPSLKALGRFLSPFVSIIFLIAFLFFLIRGFDWFINADTKYSKMIAKKLDKPTVSDVLDELNGKIARLELEIGRTENTLYEQGDRIEFNTAGSADIDMINVKNDVISKTTDLSTDIVLAEEELLFDTDDVSDGDTEDDNGINDKDIVVVKRAKMEKRVIVDNIKLDNAVSHRDEEANIFETGIQNDDSINIVNNVELDNNIEHGFDVGSSKNIKKSSIDDILNGLDDFSMDDDDEFENSSELWEKEAMKRYK